MKASKGIYSHANIIRTVSYNLDKEAHSVYALQYPFIQIVKYRRKIFINDKIIDFLKQIIRRISESFGIEVIDLEYDKDHFYMIFRSKLTLDIPKYINALKISFHETQRNFPDVKKHLWKHVLWSPSYFLATTGQVTLDVLKKYVENQGK
ncbi:MAG: IS200/IS605 family transposase [Candidatus Micrarchaeaceae archaeon]